MTYYNKYLKYKSKYLDLKNTGGAKKSSVPKKQRLDDYSKFLNKFEKFNQLNGPHVLYIYEIAGKYILLFGERHAEEMKKDCIIKKERNDINVADFFDDLFKLAPYKIDFFLETVQFFQLPMTMKQDKSMQDSVNKGIKHLQEYDNRNRSLDTLLSKFASYLGPDKSYGKYKNVRFHNVEYRRFLNDIYDFGTTYTSDSKLEEKNIFSSPLVNIQAIDIDNISDSMRKFEEHIEQLDQYKVMFVNLLNGNIRGVADNILKLFGMYKTDDAYTEENLNRYSVYYKLGKQYPNDGSKKISVENLLIMYDAIMNDKIKKIRNYVGNDEIYLQIEFYLSKIEENKKSGANEPMNIYISYINDNLDLVKFHMDNLARDIINSFSENIMNAYIYGRLIKAVNTYGSSLIIVYTGASHSEYLRDIINIKLKKKLKNTISNDKKSISNCINIIDPKNQTNILTEILRSIKSEVKVEAEPERAAAGP